MTALVSSVFSGAGLFYGIVLPLLALVLFSILILPTTLHGGARVESAGRAVYCVLMQLLGIALMALGGLPAIHGVLRAYVVPSEGLAAEVYLGLLIIFTVGGLLFLWHEGVLQSIDRPARAIAEAAYFYTLKLTGTLLLTFSALSLVLTMLLATRPLPGDFWVNPIVLLLFGLLLGWTTNEGPAKSAGFSALTLRLGKKSHGTAPKRK